MIPQETMNYMVNKMSPTEIDTCLYLSINNDWDNNVHIDVKKAAKHIGTTTKYLNEVLSKLSSWRKGAPVLTPIKTRNTSFKMNIGLSTLDYNEKTVKYCKNYKFFYSEEFRSLSLVARRLILLSSYEVSTKGTATVSFFEKNLVRKAAGESIFPLKRKALLGATQEINDKFGAYVQVAYKQSLYTDMPEYQFEYNETALIEFHQNFTERKMLRTNLYESGVRDESLFVDGICISIEKVAKSLFNSLIAEEKEYSRLNSSNVERMEAVRQIARKIYNNSVKEFSTVCEKIKKDLDSQDKVSAYFSTIVHNQMLEEATLIEARRIQHEELYHFHAVHVVNGYNDVGSLEFEGKIRHYEQLGLVLTSVCDKWVQTRVDSIAKDQASIANGEKTKDEVMKRRGWMNLGDSGKYLKNLLEKELLTIERLKERLKTFANVNVQSKAQSWLLEYQNKVKLAFKTI